VLGPVRRPPADLALVKILGDPEPPVREAAAASLGTIGKDLSTATNRLSARTTCSA